MKLFLLGCLSTVLCFEAGWSIPETETIPRLSQATQSQDVSLLKPEDIAYKSAMGFARYLDDKGIKVNSVHGSKLNGFFQGLDKAAFFRTDKGIVEVIFFPEPTGAERIRVTEQHKEGRYFYSFAGQPHPNPPGDTIDASRPMYFLMHRNWFIVLSNEEIFDALRRALTEGDPL
jgi:hypothetical protein